MFFKGWNNPHCVKFKCTSKDNELILAFVGGEWVVKIFEDCILDDLRLACMVVSLFLSFLLSIAPFLFLLTCLFSFKCIL